MRTADCTLRFDRVSVCSCAELLVLKAELELMKGASEDCAFDLEQVRFLLDVSTGNPYFPQLDDCMLHFILNGAQKVKCFHH